MLLSGSAHQIHISAPLRHKTTWQGQRRDTATGQVVPIYNVIDFVKCRQSHKRLLVDSRTYAGTLLDSDHRLLTAKVDLTQLYNVWGRIEKVRTSKRVRYNTCLLANEPYRAKFCDALSEALPEINTNASASERWSSVENIVIEGGGGIYHWSDFSDRTTRYTTLPRNGCNVRRTKKTKTMAAEHP